MKGYEYINSKAISEHLKRTGYRFSSLEMAWLIYQSRKHSAAQKHKAWMELIDTMPDCSVPENLSKEYDSLHLLLTNYIHEEQKIIDSFCKAEDNAIFQFEYFVTGDCGWTEEYERVFKTEEDCWREIEKDRNLGIEAVVIKKQYFDGQKSTLKMHYTVDKDVMGVDIVGESGMAGVDFSELWFAFPLPFEKGDILVENKKGNRYFPCREDNPFVLDDVLSWEKERIERYKQCAYACSSDMTASGYFQAEDGRIYHNSMNNYMNLDYYIGPFDGTRRLLIALSNYIKGNINLEMLLTAYRKVTMDEMTFDPMLGIHFTDDYLRMAGLSKLTKDRFRKWTRIGINHNTTFDVFEENEGNIAAIEKGIEAASNYYQPKEPIYVYGEHGSGKTMYLQCVGNLAGQLSSQRKIAYIDADDYIIEVMDFIRNGSIKSLRGKYDDIDFLLVDNIQMFQGTEIELEEFMLMFDSFITKGKQIIMAGTMPINELELPQGLKWKLENVTEVEIKRR